jgi:sugar transferase (PEP-CTERM/EpsH1 system associated)
VPRVVHLVHRFDYGGLENGIVNLVNHMPADRFSHAIVALAGIGEEFAARVDPRRVLLVSIGKRPGKDLRAYARLWRTLRTLRPAIVHTRNLGTLDAQWVALAAAVSRRVHGEHGWDAGDPQGLSPRSLRLRRACDPVVQRYVAMSRDIERWLRSDVGIAATRIRQIYNGVDTRQFRPAGHAGHRGDGRPVTIGTVGRLDAIKNQVALLHACREILDRHPDLHATLRLKIVGEGPQRQALQTLGTTLGLDHLLEMPGARSDVAEAMRDMDIFVLPSLNEGISNTILEAMGTALPVVAARVGGNPELVVDGVTGALYGPEGPAAAIERYMADPSLRARHGAAARARVVESFSLDAMIRGYVDLYDEVLHGAAEDRAAGLRAH